MAKEESISCPASDRGAYGPLPLCPIQIVLAAQIGPTLSHPHAPLELVLAPMQIVSQIAPRRRPACVPETRPKHTGLVLRMEELPNTIPVAVLGLATAYRRPYPL